MAKRAAQTANILSLKITLRGIRPPIWRRLFIPDRMTLAELHHAIQAAMGWEGGHLHAFEIAGRQFSDPDPELRAQDAANEERMTLASVAKSGVNRFTYVYDFGDNWDHSILIEKRPPKAPYTGLPACVAGKRKCPPEDCGGVWGYEELVKILADQSNPRYEEWTEIYGDDFDPEEFSPDVANAELTARFHWP